MAAAGGMWLTHEQTQLREGTLALMQPKMTSLPGTVFHPQRQEVHDLDQDKEDRGTTFSTSVAIGNSNGSRRGFTRL